MLGIEALPAVVYLVALMLVPESPRWLAMRDREQEALAVLDRVRGSADASRDLRAIRESIVADAGPRKASLRALLDPSLKLVLTIGISVGILQQITGINSVFFYAPMIFEIGRAHV